MKEKEDEELFQTDADQRDTRAKATYELGLDSVAKEKSLCFFSLNGIIGTTENFERVCGLEYSIMSILIS